MSKFCFYVAFMESVVLYTIHLSFMLVSEYRRNSLTTEDQSAKININTVKPPNSEYPKCLERTKWLVPHVTIFVKLPPNSGHLLITDNLF